MRPVPIAGAESQTHAFIRQSPCHTENSYGEHALRVTTTNRIVSGRTTCQPDHCRRESAASAIPKHLRILGSFRLFPERTSARHSACKSFPDRRSTKECMPRLVRAARRAVALPEYSYQISRYD